MKVKYYKNLVYLLLFLFVIQGCSIQQAEPKKTLSDILDVNLNVKKNGDVEQKTIYKDDNQTLLLKDNNATSRVKKSVPYEKIPAFDTTKDLDYKNQKKQLNVKSKFQKSKKVKISFESIPVNEFIEVMFGDMLNLSYTVSDAVQRKKNPITLNMSKALEKDEVYNIVKQLLDMQSISIEERNGIYFIDQKRGRRQVDKDVEESRYIGYGRKVSSAVLQGEIISMIVPFYYIDPREALDYFKLSGLKVEYKFPDSHLMMIKASRENVKKAIEIIKLVDKNSLRNYKPYLMELNYIDAEEFIVRIKEILDASNIRIAKGRKKIGVNLTAIPEINSLYILSPKKEWVDLIAFWKEKLDIEDKISLESKLYFYQVENRKADELAESINSIISMQGDANIINNQKETLKNVKKQTKNTNNSPNGGHNLTQSTSMVQADLSTNTLILKMNPVSYRNLLPIIKRLDALPVQVLAEVTLAEVTLTDTFSLGFEHALRNSAAAKDVSSSKILSSAFGGSGFAVTYASKYLDTTINAYAEDKLLNILSKPKILILNNETGNINVGTQIPIVTSENSTNDLATVTSPSILRNITYRDTGVVVGITPTINSNGVLTMSIDIELSEAQLNDTSEIDSPIIVNRSLRTSLTVNDGNTVLLGGLISKNTSTTDSGVPGLKDLPLFGSIFQSQSKKTVKTELIILIKPNILKNPDELTNATQKFTLMMDMLKKYSSN